MSTAELEVIFDAKLKEEREYWVKRLSTQRESYELPLGGERPMLCVREIETVEVNLSGTLYQDLMRLAGHSSFLLYTTLLAALKICLHRYTGSDTVVVGSPALKELGRPNALVVLDEVDERLSFRQFLLQVRETLLEAYARQRYPFHRVVKDLGWEASEGRCPLFDVALALSDIHGDLPELPTDMTIAFARRTDELFGRINFNSRLLKREDVERFRDHFVGVIRTALGNTHTLLRDFDLLTAEQRYNVEVAWNATAAEYPRQAGLADLFEAQVERTPDTVAVIYEEQHLSYAALNRAGNRLAHSLQRLGVGPDVTVGLHLSRTPELLVGLLAVLKASGAYVPLDPGAPPPRQDFILTETQACVLLTGPDGAPAGLNWRGSAIPLYGDRAPTGPAANPLRATQPDHLAYVLYTSGSTGQPKGVMVTHRGLGNYLSWCVRAYDVAAGCGSAVHSPVSFDLTVTSLLAPLLVGRGVRLLPEADGAAALAEALDRGQALGLLKLTPAHLPLLRPQLARAAAGQVDILVIGGEALAGESLAWRRATAGIRVINEYGPTETVVGCCAYEVAATAAPTASVPIGRPIANTQLYVLDGAGRPQPVGVAGELYIGGEGLARGYLRRPDQTAAAFGPNPFGGAVGGRLYRTGDRGRYLPDGNLEFLGRADRQVKLRGYRIELGEIEAALRRQAGVSEAIVAVRKDASGERRLVAYVVAEPGAERSPAGLRAAMRRTLPEYMVPALWVWLERLPLTAHGKVDRRALPAPARDPAESSLEYAAPQTAVEEILAGIWAEVLGRERVGVYDDFFELGGHSLLATQVISRVGETFRVEIPLRSLFEGPTIAALAGRIDAAIRAGDGVQAPPLRPVPRDGELPLSFAQQRLWFLDQLEPGSPLFNIPAAFRLSGALNVPALGRALGEIVRRHESLRTTFPTVKGHPAQRIAAARPLTVPIVDLANLPEAEGQQEARRIITAATRRPFELATGPLLRILLLRLKAEEHVLLLTSHHIITDGWSTSVFLRELTTLYGAFSLGASSPLPEPAIQYADFAVWQREWLQGEVLQNHLSYWTRQLAGAPATLRLPTDRPRPAIQTFRGASYYFALSQTLSEEIKALSRREGVTLFMTLLAAFQALLHYYTGQEDIVVGTDVANRNRVETEGLIGFFVNQLVLRTDLSGEPTFLELLGRVREVALAAYVHQDLPFERLVSALNPERTLQRSPLFQVKMVLQNAPTAGLKLPGLSLSSIRDPHVMAKFDLTLLLGERAEALAACFEYNPDLFDHATIHRMGQHFETVLQQVAAQPEIKLSTLTAMLAEAERKVQASEKRKAAESNLKKLKSIAPRAITVPDGRLVKTGYLRPDQSLPLVIQPDAEDLDLTDWARGNGEFVKTSLSKHGALLFRGFGVRQPSDLERLASAICADLFNENGEHPRETVSGNVYTPTFYPADKKILWHNENSFNYSWPSKLWFCCIQPARQGGETPIVDSRRVFERIDPHIRERFIQKKVMYVRNYSAELGLAWQTVFRTSDRSEVEACCRRSGMDFEWKDGDRLKTRCVRPAVIRHPKTGETAWFNQAQHWHVSCLDPVTRKSMSSLFNGEDLPRSCCYGDGTEIEDSAMGEILRVYEELEVRFPWHSGDVLLLDNLLTAHARNPFVGERKLLVVLGDMLSYEEVEG